MDWEMLELQDADIDTFISQALGFIDLTEEQLEKAREYIDADSVLADINETVYEYYADHVMEHGYDRFYDTVDINGMADAVGLNV